MADKIFLAHLLPNIIDIEIQRYLRCHLNVLKYIIFFSSLTIQERGGGSNFAKR